MEEFGYYGYEYPGHQKNEYYLAAQELIWETISSYEVKWVTSLKDGTEINVEKEKQEILRLIEENKRVPSFHLKTIYLYEGEFLELEDNNQVLENFQISNPHFRIVDDILVGQDIPRDTMLVGKLQAYDKEQTLLYRQEDSQKMATLRLTEPTEFELSVIIEGVSVQIHKVGEVWNGIENTGEWKNQNGVEFEIYAEEDIFGHFDNILYKKGEFIQKLVTKNGYVETKKLPDGKYRLIEVQGKENYEIVEPIIFEINSSVEKSKNLEVQNKLSTGKLEIVKKDLQGNLLAGVTFGLYTKNGRKLAEKVTDEAGKILWERLPVGEYQIRELKTLDGYILDTTREKITISKNEMLTVEKINVPLLPNTSGKKHSLPFVLGIFGLIVSKFFL